MRKNDKIMVMNAVTLSMLSQGGNNMVSNAIINPQIKVCEAMERWLYKFKKNSVKEATFDRLVTSFNMMRHYSISYMRIADLTTGDVQSYINSLLSDGYAYTTIKKQFNLITAFTKYLLAEGVPIRPVYLNIALPIAENVKKPKKDVMTYSKIEQAKLTKAINEDGQAASYAVLLMLENGLRSGEVLALCWEDIDWDRRAIRIHRTLVHPASRKHSFVQEGAKSKTSNRVIPLSTKAMTALEDLLSKIDSSTGLIFRSIKYPEESIGYNALRKHIKHLCSMAQIEYRGMHVFRHTFATNCYYKGCEIKKLSKLLGHASVTITYNTYIHLYGDALEELRSVVE
jgi:integrase